MFPLIPLPLFPLYALSLALCCAHYCWHMLYTCAQFKAIVSDLGNAGAISALLRICCAQKSALGIRTPSALRLCVCVCVLYLRASRCCCCISLRVCCVQFLDALLIVFAEVARYLPFICANVFEQSTDCLVKR